MPFNHNSITEISPDGPKSVIPSLHELLISIFLLASSLLAAQIILTYLIGWQTYWRYALQSRIIFYFFIHPPPHVPNLLFRFQNCDPCLLTSQSHVAPGAIGPRSDRIGSFFFENNFCRGKAVENRFHRGAAIGESDPPGDMNCTRFLNSPSLNRSR